MLQGHARTTPGLHDEGVITGAAAMSENSKNYFFWNRSFFEQAIKQDVCPYCSEWTERGCRLLNPERDCSLFSHLPQLVIEAQHLPVPDDAIYKTAVERAIPVGGRLNALLPHVLKTVCKTNEKLESRQDSFPTTGD